MEIPDSIGRPVADDVDYRFCLAGGVVLVATADLVAYGLASGDVVTALGALLFLPAALLFAGIGLSRGGHRSGRRSG
jgi:hypothetical protein